MKDHKHGKHLGVPKVIHSENLDIVAEYMFDLLRPHLKDEDEEALRKTIRMVASEAILTYFKGSKPECC